MYCATNYYPRFTYTRNKPTNYRIMTSSARTYHWLKNRASGILCLPRQPRTGQTHWRQSTLHTQTHLLHRQRMYRHKRLLKTWRKRGWHRHMQLLRPLPPTDTAGALASAWRRMESVRSYGMIFPPQIHSRPPFRPLSTTTPSPTTLEPIALRVFCWNKQY